MMVASVKRFVLPCVPSYLGDKCCSGADVLEMARGVPFDVRV